MNVLLKQYFHLLAAYLRPQWPQVSLLAVLLAGSIALQLINPQLVRIVLDTTQASAVQSSLILAALLFIFFSLAQAAINFSAIYVGENVSWTATNELRADLALHCLRLDMAFHNAHTPGELIERIDGDVSELANFFAQLTLRVLANVILVLGIVLLLYREDWRMGLAATLYALLTLAILRAVQQRTVRLWVEAREGNAGLYGFIEERLAGVEDVRANGGEAYVLRRLAQLQAATYQAHNQARMFGVFTFSVTHMLFVLAGALGLGLGAYLYLQDQATIGAVYLIIYYLNILRAPLEELRDRVDELQHATASIGRVHELLQMKYMSTGRRQDTVKAEEKRRKEERMIPSTSNLQPSSSPLALRFDRVSFRYTDAQSHEHVLQEVAFELASGKVLGLLGRTGSGKTTLTRLLLRLYEPTYGAIWLNGQSLRDVSLPELRRCVGMVTQEVQLFQASLRENITLFDPGIPDEQILNVLRELGLWDWYCAQPYGLETRLSGGSSLSAGEAQLLAFVRVFLRDPRLVILDEASSRLDPATEQLLERAIDRLLYNRTAIIIAHRLETVRRADDILILEDGRVVENGRRRALANDPNSRFYGLLQTGLQEALA